jgi:hypothetical protein
MRSSTINILSLVILIANLVLTSPVPKPAKNISVWASTTDTNDRDITTSLADLLTNIEENGDDWEIWECPLGQTECHLRKHADGNAVKELLVPRSDLETTENMDVAAQAEVNRRYEKVCSKMIIRGREVEYCWWTRLPLARRNQDNVANDHPGVVIVRAETNGLLAARSDLNVTSEVETDGRPNDCYKLMSLTICRPRWLPPSQGDQYKRGDGDAVVVKESDTGASASSENLGSRNDLEASSLKTLLGRQLVDSTLLEINKPCATDLIANHENIDFDTMSADEKKALLIAIIDCMYGPSATPTNAGGPNATDIVFGSEAGRCPMDLIQNSFLRTHWDFLEEKDKIIWWMVLAYCLGQEPGKVKQLQAGQDARVDREKTRACMKSAVQHWPGNLSTKEDVGALTMAMKKCVVQPRMRVAARDLGHFLSFPAKDDQCINRVKENWTGDFSTKEERNAFMLELMRCGNEAQG